MGEKANLGAPLECLNMILVSAEREAGGPEHSSHLAPDDFSARESDNSYRRLALQINGHWRVVVCRDGIQWILQHLSRDLRPDGSGWEGCSYCTTRTALIRSIRSRCGPVAPPALTALNDLPERITTKATQAEVNA